MCFCIFVFLHFHEASLHSNHSRSANMKRASVCSHLIVIFALFQKMRDYNISVIIFFKYISEILSFLAQPRFWGQISEIQTLILKKIYQRIYCILSLEDIAKVHLHKIYHFNFQHFQNRCQYFCTDWERGN